MASEENFPNITEWMDNQTIFITGVSGFVGKVLLYKLLKSCSNVKTIYVLIRTKKGKAMEERLNQMLSGEEFKIVNPDVLTKIKGIAGDICEERLGIQESDWRLLQENVTLVFNVAASVRFDDTLQKATFTNLRSTKYALLLAKGMENLKAFVHVSTAYTNCHFPNIPETVIPTNVDPEQMIRIAEKSDEHKLEVLNLKILQKYPNTYIFTKNLAEDLISKHRLDLPVVIIRPSIVVSSTKEPKPGWCDSISSIMALLTAGGKGIFRVNLADPKKDLDYITVDACVNAMIVAAWYKNSNFPERENSSEKFVFNTTDIRRPYEYLINISTSLQYNYPLRNQLWLCFVIYAKAHWYFLLMTFLFHILPGLIVDGALRIKGRTPILMKIYRKIFVVSMAIKHFTLNAYTFETKNFEMLKSIVPQKEKETFFMDSFYETTIKKYMVNACLAARHLVGDPPEIYKEDVVRVRRLYWIDKMCRLILLGLLIWILPYKSGFDWALCKMNEYNEYLDSISEY